MLAKLVYRCEKNPDNIHQNDNFDSNMYKYYLFNSYNSENFDSPKKGAVTLPSR